MESLLFPIIMLAVTLIGGGILLLFLKTSKKPPQTDAGSTAMQTAQQFINVKDIRDKYLYTRGDGIYLSADPCYQYRLIQQVGKECAD